MKKNAYIEIITRPPEFDGKWWLPDPVDTRHLDNDDFELLADFRVGTPDGKTFLINKGFIYDKASIPRLVWFYIPRDDKDIEKACLVHDMLYVIQRINGEWLKRKYVDQLFRDIMKEEGMRFDKRFIAYRGVRIGGWVFWNKTAEDLGNIHYIES